MSAVTHPTPCCGARNVIDVVVLYTWEIGGNPALHRTSYSLNPTICDCTIPFVLVITTTQYGNILCRRIRRTNTVLLHNSKRSVDNRKLINWHTKSFMKLHYCFCCKHQRLKTIILILVGNIGYTNKTDRGELICIPPFVSYCYISRTENLP